MPVIRTEGFVLRSYPLGEADKIVTFFSRDEGKVRAVARSARKSRRRFGSSLELWSRVSLHIFEKEGKAGTMDFLVSEMTGVDQKGRTVFTARSTAIIRP